MDIQKKSIDGKEGVMVTIVGQCAVDQVEVLRQELKQLYEMSIFNIHIDFSRCDFIDSTGLGALVSIHKRCAERGSRLVIHRPSEEVTYLLTMTRLDNVFDIRH